MKTTLQIATVIVCALCTAQTFAATHALTDWYAVLDEVQLASQQNAGGRARAKTILGDVLAAARNSLPAHAATGRSAEAPPLGADLEAASAQAAYSALVVLYPENLSALDDRFREALSLCVGSASAIAAGRQWGEHVAQAVLTQHGDAVALSPGSIAQAAKAPDLPPTMLDPQSAEGDVVPGSIRFKFLAGAPGIRGHVDGIGSSARFDNPARLAVDAAGNVYVSEYTLCTIRKIKPNGEVTTLAGTAGQRGDLDGVGAAARFNGPTSLAVDAAGNVFVSDSGNHTIRRIDPAGNVTTVAGRSGIKGSVDGPKDAAELNSPSGLVVDASGNLFLLEEEYSKRIRRITPNGTVTTLSIKFNDSQSFYKTLFVTHLAVDRKGNLYAHHTDGWDFSHVLKLTPTAEGDYSATLFASGGFFTAMGQDEAGKIYVHDYYDYQHIMVIAADGEVRFRVFSIPASANGIWKDIAVGRDGTLYGLLENDGSGPRTTVEIGVYDPTASPLKITAHPSNQHVHAGNNASFQVIASGAEPLSYQWYFNGAPLSGASQASLTLQNVQVANAGNYHVVVSDPFGSVTSWQAILTISPPITASPSSTASTSATSSPSTGGGSLDRDLALALLCLLVAAKLRHPGSTPAVAP